MAVTVAALFEVLWATATVLGEDEDDDEGGEKKRINTGCGAA